MKAKVQLLKGKNADVISANVSSLKNAGYSHNHATHLALKHSHKGSSNKKFEEKDKSISNKTSEKTEKLDNLGG